MQDAPYRLAVPPFGWTTGSGEGSGGVCWPIGGVQVSTIGLLGCDGPGPGAGGTSSGGPIFTGGTEGGIGGAIFTCGTDGGDHGSAGDAAGPGIGVADCPPFIEGAQGSGCGAAGTGAGRSGGEPSAISGGGSDALGAGPGEPNAISGGGGAGRGSRTSG
jgi:hypothetical protein